MFTPRAGTFWRVKDLVSVPTVFIIKMRADHVHSESTYIALPIMRAGHVHTERKTIRESHVRKQYPVLIRSANILADLTRDRCTVVDILIFSSGRHESRVLFPYVRFIQHSGAFRYVRDPRALLALQCTCIRYVRDPRAF